MIRNLGDIIYVVLNAAWRRRYLLVIPMLLMPVVAYFASDKVTKSYSTGMSILIQEPAALNPFLEDFALSPNLKERMAPLKALLKSEHVLSDVLTELGEFDANTSPIEKLRKVRTLSRSIDSRLIGQEVIKLTITGSKSEGLAKRLNAVAKHFIERIVAPERSSVEGSEKFLRAQMNARAEQLQQAEARLVSFKVENAENLPEIYQSNIGRLTTLQDLYDTKVIELSAAERSLKDLRKRLSGTNPLIGNLEEKIVNLSSELVSLKARYTDSHSKVRNAETKLARLRAERSELLSVSTEVSDDELDRLFNIAMGQSGGFDENGQSPFLVSQMLRLQDAQSNKTALEKEVEQIRIKIDQLNNGIARFGPIERKMQALERNIRIAQQLHEKLMERYEMARVTGALGRFEAPERVKIIDAPQDPHFPDTPGRIAFIIGGIIGGIVMGIGLATITEMLDPTVRSARELAHRLELPILSRVSYIQVGDVTPPPTGGGIDPIGPALRPKTIGRELSTKREKLGWLLGTGFKCAKKFLDVVLPIVEKIISTIWKIAAPLLSRLIAIAFSKLGVGSRP